MEKYRTAGRLIILSLVTYCRNLSEIDSLRYNSYLLLCMDNNLDHSFERKLLSTGRKLQLTLGPI